MIKIGDRVVVTRRPTPQEDPEEAWLPEFEVFLNAHGTILKDDHPYSQDTMYAYVEVDHFTDFFLPMAILTPLT